MYRVHVIHAQTQGVHQKGYWGYEKTLVGYE